MTSQRVIFFGESHINAVQNALRKTGLDLDGVEVEAHRLTKIKNGALIGTLNFQDLLSICGTLSERDLVISVVGGNQHSAFSLIQHDIPFDVVAADGTPQADDANITYLPRSTVKAVFEAGLRNNDAQRIKEVAASGKHQTIHLAAPPPKADNAHIMQRFETDFAAKGLAEKGVSPAHMRQRIWQIQNEVLADILAEDGIPLVPPHPKTMTPDGFLRPEFYAADATHANAKYGNRILDQVRDYLTGAAAAAS